MDWPERSVGRNLPQAGRIEWQDRDVSHCLKEPIREELLAAPGASVGLTAKIPDGMRAVAVITNELNNVSGFLFPGSHVDVLVTFHPRTAKTR